MSSPVPHDPALPDATPTGLDAAVRSEAAGATEPTGAAEATGATEPTAGALDAAAPLDRHESIAGRVADAVASAAESVSPFAHDVPTDAQPALSDTDSKDDMTPALQRAVDHLSDSAGQAQSPVAHALASAMHRAQDAVMAAEASVERAFGAAAHSAKDAALAAERIMADVLAPVLQGGAAAERYIERELQPAVKPAVEAAGGIAAEDQGGRSAHVADTKADTSARTTALSSPPTASRILDSIAHSSLIDSVVHAAEALVNKMDETADAVVAAIEDSAREAAEGSAANLGTHEAKRGTCVVVQVEPVGGGANVNAPQKTDEEVVLTLDTDRDKSSQIEPTVAGSAAKVEE